jgi:hypothetical protein
MVNDSDGARTPGGARARLVLDSASWCYLAAGLVVCWNIWRIGATSILDWGVSLSIPSAAILLYWLVSLLVPSLYAPRRLVFPLNLTLPAVYVSLMVLCVALGTRVGSALVALPEPMQLMARLANGTVLLESYFVAVALLTLAGRKPRDSDDAGPTVDSR